MQKAGGNKPDLYYVMPHGNLRGKVEQPEWRWPDVHLSLV